MSNVIFLSHGGGPLPLLQEDGHKEMIQYYKEYAKTKHPKAIIVISAHYESETVKVIYQHPSKLLYDYYGFPKETYEYQYNPPINQELGETILKKLTSNGIEAKSEVRGFDHGVFVPLLIMFPNADIPVIQISLQKNLDPKKHIKIGEALSGLDDVLYIGSGSSYHNLREYMNKDIGVNHLNDEFQDALKDIITSNIDEKTREENLINYQNLPNTNFVHPRVEHLIPLHVCYGIAKKAGKVIFDDQIFGKRNICVEWEI